MSYSVSKQAVQQAMIIHSISYKQLELKTELSSSVQWLYATLWCLWSTSSVTIINQMSATAVLSTPENVID